MASKDEERHERRKSRKASNAVVWAILALLILALGGFGIGSFGGTIRTVATVGEAEVTTNDYARALQNESARLAQASGGAFPPEAMRALGLDRQVLDRLVAVAALENEAAEMDLSVGDVAVAEAIRANPAFAATSGGFDREGYAFVLRNANLTEAAFEARTRADLARGVLQAAVLGGVAGSGDQARLLAEYVGETRAATVAEVGLDRLPEPVGAPNDEDLAVFYDLQSARFERPERKRLTVAWLRPEAVADGLDVPEAEIVALYEGSDDYVRPARVLAERLAFADAAAAEAALAAIVGGETTFDALVAERGLTLEDVDQGELSADDVAPEVAEALFALTGPGIAGPVPTDLGPALFRVNAVLAASTTPLEEVRDDLRREIAAERAARAVDERRDALDDALAGGATLEELADEGLEVTTLDWSAEASEGIAGFAAFRDAAAAVEEGDFPELIELDDGGLAALRVDAVLPAEVPPLEEIREEVAAAWTVATTRDALHDQARADAEALRGGATFEALGLTPMPRADLRRGVPMAGLPASLTEAAFALSEAGEVEAVIGDDVTAYVVRVDAIEAPDLAGGEGADLLAALEGQLAQGAAADLFEAYGQAVQARTGVSVNTQAVQAVTAQIGG